MITSLNACSDREAMMAQQHKTIRFTPLATIGSIVWCRFLESVGMPGPKPRPALVIAVSPTDHAVIVVYGASQKTHQINPGEFLIQTTDADFELTGLAYDTKFNLNNEVKLFYDSNWFDVAPAWRALPIPITPRMGTLPASYYDAVRRAAAHLKK
ncbi:hypothetical protein V2H77_18855 [Photorhabdus sp. P32]|uniref:hypothetical protein n=1 Tax=Photorhabdus sp. P32 TaxID=3117549 RepID=UPI00311ACDF8